MNSVNNRTAIVSPYQLKLNLEQFNVLSIVSWIILRFFMMNTLRF